MMIHFMKIPAVLVLLKIYNDYFPLLNDNATKMCLRILRYQMYVAKLSTQWNQSIQTDKKEKRRKQPDINEQIWRQHEYTTADWLVIVLWIQMAFEPRNFARLAIILNKIYVHHWIVHILRIQRKLFTGHLHLDT